VTTPRIQPGGRREVGAFTWALSQVAGIAARTEPMKLFLTLGRRAGLSDEELTRVTQGSAAPGWSDRERALLAAAEALHPDGDMDDETWSALRRHLDEREAIELCMLAGHYEMLATVIAALRIQPDAPRTRARRSPDGLAQQAVRHFRSEGWTQNESPSDEVAQPR
jgi:hypothetical protein